MSPSTPTNQGATSVDPLANLGVDITLVAELAMGPSRSEELQIGARRHLAWLAADALELDLNDPREREFGDYDLIELVGEGGMGVVYRAHQRSLDREVAVKLLAAGPWASKDFIERFRREAQNAARMHHPNIVTIFEVGSFEELHFFSMQLISGPSLAAVLKDNGKLSPMRAAQLLRTIAEAVDYAHRLDVLHLDLKPANVLLDENAVPHVADFGLARRLDQSLSADNREMISGTPSYMAPEQAIGRTQKISPATDIWGLGGILYELVTGQPPFVGDTPEATLKLVVEGKLRNPRRYCPSLPRDLEAIILKCMQRAAIYRYPGARALVDDLTAFIEGRAVKARPLNAPQRIARWMQREPITAAAVFGIVLALCAGLASTSMQWRRAEVAVKQAQEREEQIEAAIMLLSNLAEANTPAGEVISQMTLIEERLSDHPEVAASLLETLGLRLTDKGNPQLAVEVLDKATRMAMRAYGPDALETKRLLPNKAWAEHELGDLGAAEQDYRTYLSALAGLEGNEGLRFGHVESHLALVLLDEQKLQEAERLSRSAVAILESKGGPDADWTNYAAYGLGRALLAEGRASEAETLLRRAADAFEKLYSYDVRIAIYCRYYLGISLAAQGQHAKADALIERSLSEAAKVPWTKVQMGRPLIDAMQARGGPQTSP